MPSRVMSHNNTRHIRLSVQYFILGTMFLLFVSISAAAANSKSEYLYSLSSFNGTVQSLWPRLAVDQETGEVYTLNRHKSLVQIYNQSAMLIHSYGEEYRLSSAVDIAAGNKGELYVIQGSSGQTEVLRLDFKGERLGSFDLDKIPEAFMPFRPSRVDFENNKLYLLDANSLNLIVFDLRGDFLKGYRLGELLKKTLGEDAAQSKKIHEMTFNGFCVDPKGAMYFTAPSSFIAFRLDTDGTLRGFGSSGSGPGKFGVVAGIDADSEGTIYITDRLRSVVLIFNDDFKFIREFGYRGAAAENLIAPDDIAVDEQNGRIYVAQAANRGVSVFRVPGQ